RADTVWRFPGMLDNLWTLVTNIISNFVTNLLERMQKQILVTVIAVQLLHYYWKIALQVTHCRKTEGNRCSDRHFITAVLELLQENLWAHREVTLQSQTSFSEN